MFFGGGSAIASLLVSRHKILDMRQGNCSQMIKSCVSLKLNMTFLLDFLSLSGNFRLWADGV